MFIWFDSVVARIILARCWIIIERLELRLALDCLEVDVGAEWFQVIVAHALNVARSCFREL